MIQARHAKTLGIALALVVSVRADAQQVQRPSTLPPMRFGTLPQANAPQQLPSDGRRIHDGSHLFGRGFGRLTTLGLARAGYFDAPYWSQPVVVPYQVPVYIPVPVPVYPREYVRAPEAPAKPYDPTKSKMLTIGAGADGGGGVMRIEQVNDSVVRLTWLGSSRPIRDARLFLADSMQRPLRTSLVDANTPGALFQIAGLEQKIAYTGLTINFADGSTQTTLVPYRRR